MMILRIILVPVIILLTFIHPCEGFVPGCFSQATTTGRIVCEGEDLKGVNAQDMSAAFQQSSVTVSLLI